VQSDWNYARFQALECLNLASWSEPAEEVALPTLAEAQPLKAIFLKRVEKLDRCIRHQDFAQVIVRLYEPRQLQGIEGHLPKDEWKIDRRGIAHVDCARGNDLDHVAIITELAITENVNLYASTRGAFDLLSQHFGVGVVWVATRRSVREAEIECLRIRAHGEHARQACY
jgi:hypothetical protein